MKAMTTIKSEGVNTNKNSPNQTNKNKSPISSFNKIFSEYEYSYRVLGFEEDVKDCVQGFCESLINNHKSA